MSSRWLRANLAAIVALLVSATAAASAGAETAAPQWTVTSVAAPTNFTPGSDGSDFYLVTVKNTGGGATDGSTVTITDELPAGLSLAPGGASGEDNLHATHLTCVLRSCTYGGTVVPDESLTVTVPVDVALPEPASVTNVVRVAGGGAPDAAVSTSTTISSTPAGFGFASGGAATSLSTTQAGAHPDLTTAVAFNTVEAGGALAADPKDMTDDLPPGFAGDLLDTPSCSTERFSVRECPLQSQVGVVTLTLTVLHKPRVTVLLPVYNLTPNAGALAKLGFYALNVFPVETEVLLRPSDYGLRAVFYNTDESSAELDAASLTIWGVPAQPVHNPLRWEEEGLGVGHFGVASNAPPVPFLTNPTICSGETLSSVFTADSWEHPETTIEETMPLGPLSGCDSLTMAPTLSILPTTSRAYSPTGLHLKMTVPQTYENAEGRATANLNRAVVTLPEGMTVNPSAGAGLEACTQLEFEEEPVQQSPGRGCPSTARLGAVEISTPALKESAVGSVYIAQPYQNQFGSLLALYVVARIPERGVLVKAAGRVAADPITGRLTTTFEDLPPLPFGTLTFRFREGATAPLVTPALCGSYAPEAQLTPWSDLAEILAPPIAPFPITSAFDGGACPAGIAPFAPQVTAGTLDDDAGSYSPLDIRIARNDGEQEITGFASRLPLGLSADLSGVPFCSEADIALARSQTGAQEQAEPSCPAASEIGYTLAGAGVGSVFAYAPGKIYLAGPFEGAPFSIVSITAARVGPFDLGTVVVHLPLEINPLTAAVSVGAGAADQIPHIIDGIVIHLREIHAYIDRARFTFNPTSCNPMSVSATVIGSGASFANPADDAPVTVADHFQAANCQSLQFKPVFKASTSGKTSKQAGASLSVKLTYPNAPQGTQANIARVKVDLPKQLPSRLNTLQRACTAATFAANPAACPAASVVGHAKAVTPILPVALEGPAYFVSHGGEVFPEPDRCPAGIWRDDRPRWHTFISKAGITSSTFQAVPDQPVTSFELTLPEGRYSALSAFGDLCKSKLAMPTAFVAQNGAEIHERTPIGVSGCPKIKKTTRKVANKGRKRKKK